MRTSFFLFCAVLLLTTGCCPKTGDPRQGGLFCWNEGQAIQRQRDLSGTLAQEKDRVQSAQKQSTTLEQDKRATAAELEHQRSRLAGLEKELNDIRRRIQQIKVNTAAKLKEKQRIENRIGQLQNKITSVRNSKNLSFQRKNEEMNRLESYIYQLFEMISAL